MTQSDYSEITGMGMLQTPIGWVKIQTTLLPEKESDLAYYGMIKVDEFVGKKLEPLYKSSKTDWIPKSMAQNVWWICTNKFDETRKVSNKIFIPEYYGKVYHEKVYHDPYKLQKDDEELN